MNIFWFVSLFSFFMLSIDEGDGGAVEEPAEEESSEPEEAATPEEAVLEELGLNEGAEAEEEQTQAEEPAAEAKPEEVQPEATEPGDITDADLEPLNSKNQKTNERFHKVTEGYKAEKARAEQLEGQVAMYQESLQAIRDLGYTDEAAAQDLVNFADYRKAIYSGDVEGFQRILADQIRQFEVMYGKKVNVRASVMDEHPDLAAKVDNFDMDEATAFELARNRSLQDRAMRDAQQRNQAAAQQQQQQQVVYQAADYVDSMQRHWQENDPDFAAILPHLQPYMQEIGKSYPPHMWPQVIDLQYKSIKKALTETRQREASSGMPLRGNGHMSGRPAPTTVQEAVLQELDL